MTKKYTTSSFGFIEKMSIPINISRTVDGNIVNGEYIDGGTIDLATNLCITTAKKEDYAQDNIGNQNYVLLKIRQSKIDINQVRENDKFIFDNSQYNIVKKKNYMEHLIDFNVWYAVSEVE